MGSIRRKNKLPVIDRPENRGEIVQKEIKLDDVSEQWDEMQTIYNEGLNSVILEQQQNEREKQALIKRKKVFDEINYQKIIREADEHNRILEIERKIKNKKKLEIKRRDIAFRNKSFLG